MSDLREMKVLWDLGRLQFCDVSSFIDLLINENESLKNKSEESIRCSDLKISHCRAQ